MTSSSAEAERRALRTVTARPDTGRRRCSSSILVSRASRACTCRHAHGSNIAADKWARSVARGSRRVEAGLLALRHLLTVRVGPIQLPFIVCSLVTNGRAVLHNSPIE